MNEKGDMLVVCRYVVLCPIIFSFLRDTLLSGVGDNC